LGVAGTRDSATTTTTTTDDDATVGGETNAAEEGDGVASAAGAGAADNVDDYEEFDDDDDEKASDLASDVAEAAKKVTLLEAEITCRAGLAIDSASLPLKTLLQDLRDAGHSTNEEADRAGADPAAADALKVEGNAHFQAKR
jgi:hypothetical protein